MRNPVPSVVHCEGCRAIKLVEVDFRPRIGGATNALLPTKKLEHAVGWAAARHHAHIPLPWCAPLHRDGVAAWGVALRPLHRPRDGRASGNARHLVLGRSEGTNLFTGVGAAGAVLRAGGDGGHDGGGEAVGDGDGELCGVLKCVPVRAKCDHAGIQHHGAGRGKLWTIVNWVATADNATRAGAPSHHFDELAGVVQHHLVGAALAQAEGGRAYDARTLSGLRKKGNLREKADGNQR